MDGSEDIGIGLSHILLEVFSQFFIHIFKMKDKLVQEEALHLQGERSTDHLLQDMSHQV